MPPHRAAQEISALWWLGNFPVGQYDTPLGNNGQEMVTLTF